MSEAQTVTTKRGKKRLNQKQQETSLPAPYTPRQLETMGQMRLPLSSVDACHNQRVAMNAWWLKNKAVQR